MSSVPRENPPFQRDGNSIEVLARQKECLEAEGDTFSRKNMRVKIMVEELEHEIGDWTETIDYSDTKYCVLPTDICIAVKKNNIQKVLNWLGPPPVDKQRVNAKDPDRMADTLVHCAVHSQNSDLLSILLQLGADVDQVDATGTTPFVL